jgi:hypothetical protein
MMAAAAAAVIVESAAAFEVETLIYFFTIQMNEMGSQTSQRK